MQDLSKISVVLPSLDPDEKLIAVVDGLLEYGFSDIILINDGSKPENLHYFHDLAAQHPEIHLLHHEVNKGKGAALKNAFRWFLENRPDGYGVVTVDGDNTETIGTVFQEPPECVFQSGTFTLVHFVMKQMNLRMLSGQIVEIVEIFGLTAIIDQNDVGKTVFQQTVNHGNQLLVRIERGQNNRNFG